MAKSSTSSGGSGRKKKAAAPLVSGQKSMFAFFGKAKSTSAGASATTCSAGASAAGGGKKSAGSAAIVAKKADSNNPAVPETPDTLPCSPETPGGILRGEENENKAAAAAAAAAAVDENDDVDGITLRDGIDKGKISSEAKETANNDSMVLEDSDDDDEQLMKTPSTGRKKLGARNLHLSGGSSSSKRRVIDDDDGIDGIDDKRNADADDGEQYVDNRVAKDFDGDIYLGTITDYNAGEGDDENGDGLWHVEYDDGDEEDYVRKELDQALDLYRTEGRGLDRGTKKSVAAAKRRIEEDADYGSDDEEDADVELEGLVDSDDDDGEVVAAAPKPARKKVKTHTPQSAKLSSSSTSRSSSNAKKEAPKTSTSEAGDTRTNKEDQATAKRKTDAPSTATKAVEPVAKKSKSDTSNTSAAASAKPKAKSSVPVASGWGMFKRQTAAEIKAQSKSKKKKGEPKGDADATAPVRAYTDGDDLEIISDPQEMFNDMINNNLIGASMTKLDPLIRTVAGRPLRVATMCSGTESPVLALDMISKSIEDFYLKHRREELSGEISTNEHVLQIEHVFSCEIEPFKQAYIERNFSPPLLFRDIRELGKDRACTAYGSLAQVPNTPGTVDVLVAGTSCVDFSNLNNEQKKITEKGESAQTFRGMMDWVGKAQPPLVILENVSGAPWQDMIELMESLGYYADFARVDTKKYYIPHTRMRGYLLAVKKGKGIDRLLLRRWKEMLKSLERNASGALDEFMLPNDDPRVLRGRASIVAGGNSGKSNKTEWTKCEGRHLLARSAEELGDKRPLTGWSDSNPTSMPGWAWNDWAEAQVHRVHDLLDINTLRLAKQGVDCTFKTMVWDVSQNVDRATIGKLGLSQCLTPSGINYIPSRGGPLVGEELLLLQGIPADDLLLTRESDKQLKDLAGNAMSTTVVGACILSALVLGHQALANEEAYVKSVGDIVDSLVPRALSISTDEITVSRAFGQYQERELSLESGAATSGARLAAILAKAASSARKCITEGTDQVLPTSELLVCRECNHTCRRDLATPPRKYEEHLYASFAEESETARVRPAEFRRELIGLIPIQISISNLQVKSDVAPAGVDERLWKTWFSAFDAALTPAPEFRFSKLIRSNIWTVQYVASSECSLELRLSEHEAIWYLFVKAPSRQGKLRDALSRPVARMIVKESSDEDMSSSSFSFLRGEWEICLPIDTEVEVTVEGVGERVESWESKLGLKGRFEGLERHEKLEISLDASAPASLKHAVEGCYKLLPKCGAACGSLHKRESSVGNETDAQMFFFLESGRRKLPTDDAFVFSQNKHRTSYGEYRPIELQMEENYRPSAPSKEVEKEDGRIQKRTGIIPGKWTKVENASATAVTAATASVLTVPLGKLGVSLSANAWQNCPELLSLTVPLHASDELVEQCQSALAYVASAQERQNTWMDVNINKSKKVFDALAFATARLAIPSDAKKWTQLETSQAAIDEGDGDYIVCSKCSPPKPSVRWTVTTSGSKKKYEPKEDGREAAAYERAMKTRPGAFKIQLKLALSDSDAESASLNLRIGVNSVALTQSALGFFPRESYARRTMAHVVSAQKASGSASSGCIFEWRVQPHANQISPASASFPKLRLTSNKKDGAASQPPNFTKFPLRPEQLRSLSWMLSQEASDAPFYEEEVAEGILPSLGWRTEGRVRRPVMVRGGIIADEVGYGKTAITLGLIDAASQVNGEPKRAPKEFLRLFETNATLVIIPTHLMGQWPSEINKFLGDSKKVICIKDIASFNNLTVNDITSADIVLVNFTVLSNQKYFERLARLTGINGRSLPSGGGKAGDGQFNAVYESCVSKLAGRVQQLKEDASSVYNDIENEARFHLEAEQNAEAGVRLDGKKAVYKNVSEEQAKVQDDDVASTSTPASSSKKKTKSGTAKVVGKDLDPWDLSSSHVKRDVGKMRCPPLEMFHWNRLVVDEFHYMVEKMNRQRVYSLMLGLRSSNRWCLSGTPPHANFKDVQSLASLLGVYLGKDEPLPGALAAKKSEGKTSLEAFSALLEVKSMQWHERRHGVAQGFLDRFVRQNIAEIDEIPQAVSINVVNMPPAERAIYLEMESYLRSLDMNAKGAMKSKKKSRGDRELRMQDLLKSAESGEEALLKKCAHFDLSSDSAESMSARDTCDRISKLRKKELDETLKHLKDNIVSALRQRIQIVKLPSCSNWEGTERSEKGEVEDRLAAYIKGVEENRSVSGGADAEIHKLILSVLREAQGEVKTNPMTDVVDPFYAEANSETHPAEEGKEGEKKNPKQREFDMKYALREHVHDIRALGKELCARSRSLRYFSWVRDFQNGKAVVCEARTALCACEKEDGKVKQSDSGVLSSCGHVGCLKCLYYHAGKDECVDSSCQAPIKSSDVISARDLGMEQDSKGEDEGSAYGAKLSAIVKNVKSIVKQNDRVIVFVQFQDLKEKVAEALERVGVKTLQVKGTVNQQIKSLSILQKEVPDKKDPRVLLLTMDDESSAGVNLTTCNHAVFVHPLLAGTQQQYEAYETQAIGRIRRYGQTKTVHIWRYFARNTVDGDIYKERTGENVNALPSE